MNSVNKTLYIPLYGKAYVSKKGIILSDKKAEEIWKEEGFALKGKSKYKDPVKDVGVTNVYGIDDPRSLQHGAFSYV